MAAKYLRGQQLRIYNNNATFVQETSCSVQLNTNLEDASTKDDTEGWDNQEVMSRSWTMSADIKANGGANIATLIKSWIDSDSFALKAQVSSSLHPSLSGNAILTQLDIDATVKQNVTASATWTGVGAIA